MDTNCWLKCEPCGHVWSAAQLPMDMEAFAKTMSKAKCPCCGEKKRIKLTKSPTDTGAAP